MNCLKALFFLLLLSNTAAPQIEDPGNSTSTAFGGIRSTLNHRSNGNVNLFTGQAMYHLELAKLFSKSGLNLSVDLNYSSVGIRGLVDSVNEDSLYEWSWTGIGWYIGFSYITVDHKNTTNMQDDMWYYHYNDGSISRIFRGDSTFFGDSIFKIENNRNWRVFPHYNQPSDTDYKIIDGWIVISEDGSVFKYGDFYSTTPSANRNVKCSGNTIGVTLTGSVRNFYYRWDLASLTDVNGDSITLRYQRFSRRVDAGLYTGEGYVWYICSNLEDTIWFDIAPKNTEEGPSVRPSVNTYNFNEYYYLNRIRLGNGNRGYIDTISFSYGSLNYGVAGKEKRVISALNSSKDFSTRSFSFAYDQTQTGFLSKVKNTKFGDSTIFTYKLQENRRIYPYVNVIVVDSIKISGGNIGVPVLKTVFSYTGDESLQYYDVKYGIGYWGNAGYNSGNGDVSFFFSMEKNAWNQSIPGHSFGAISAKKIYNTGGSLVSSTNYTIIALNNYTYFYDNSQNITNGVFSQNGNLLGHWIEKFICQENDLPTLTYSIYSDSTAIVSYVKFAHEIQLRMGPKEINPLNSNMLLQITENKSYKFSHFYSYLGALNRDSVLVHGILLKSIYTTWSNCSGVWRPAANYIWDSNMDGNGNPISSFVDFDTAHPTSNNWICTSTFDRYDPHGHLIQSTDGAGTKNAAMYGTQACLPMAAIANSSFLECGAFTCDYNLKENGGYWDYTNGWEKGADKDTNPTGVELTSLEKHFGQKSLHVIQTYAAGRNNRIYPNKEYVMSAWVKVTSGTIYMKTDYRFANSGFESSWPIATSNMTTVSGLGSDSAISISASDCNGSWILMTLKIPLSKTSKLDSIASAYGKTPSTTVWYARAWVGNDPAYPSFTAYVDDVRFGPSNSLITTTYYDTLWRKPILSVDPSNLPGRLTTYDQYGRVSRQYKIDMTKSRSFPANDKLTMKKIYHLMGD